MAGLGLWRKDMGETSGMSGRGIRGEQRWIIGDGRSGTISSSPGEFFHIHGLCILTFKSKDTYDQRDMAGVLCTIARSL